MARDLLSYADGSLDVFTDFDAERSGDAPSQEFKPLLQIYNGNGDGSKRLSGRLLLNGSKIAALSASPTAPQILSLRRNVNNLNQIRFEPSFPNLLTAINNRVKTPVQKRVFFLDHGRSLAILEQASTKEHFRTSIVMSIGLKFSLHRKHRAKFVL
jgi:hypothetical protein